MIQHPSQEQVAKEKVTGIGGVFFKARDPRKLIEWYESHLGVQPMQKGETSVMFQWREKENPNRLGYTVWAIFPRETKYFDPSKSEFMVNFRVNNLDEVLKDLKSEGVRVDEKVEEFDYGKFGWVMDPEGNRIELWEPKNPTPTPSRKS
jgi:predicted enzyme related to lactoylglutathione lyase